MLAFDLKLASNIGKTYFNEGLRPQLLNNC